LREVGAFEAKIKLLDLVEQGEEITITHDRHRFIPPASNSRGGTAEARLRPLIRRLAAIPLE
jgi:antitoxin (DNA-binding transcriptional repressor) of toxin-antitoxin stability system